MAGSQTRRRSSCRRGAALAAIAVAVIAVAAADAATLSPAEKAFSKAYERLVPTLNKASVALVHAVDGTSKDTDAQAVTIFGGVARQWASATKPLLALHAPAPEAQIFTAMSRLSRAVESDLLAVVKSIRTHSASGAKSSGRRLVLDFNALAATARLLKAKLGLR